MAEAGKKWGRGNVWSEEEYATVRAHPDLTHRELAELMGKSRAAISNVRHRMRDEEAPPPEETYAYKPLGTYIEILSSYLVDEFDCLEVWMRWNGYSHINELSRDQYGWVTLACYSKG